MKRSTWIVSAAAVVVALCMGCASPGPSPGPNPGDPVVPLLSCVVQGTPVEFPNDILVTNQSIATLAAGRTIEWSHMNQSGTHDLEADLGPSQSIYISDLPFADEAGKECKAKVVP